MNATRILAMDPGKTTGIAIHDLTENVHTPQELNFRQTADLLYAEATRHGEDLLIVSESFLITVNTAKNTQAAWSLELIGIARWLSQRYCGRDLVLQSPAQAKRFSSDARLKHLGWWAPGKGHANDASRHLLVAEVTRGIVPQATLQEFATIS